MLENYQLVVEGLLAEARRGLSELELAALSDGGSREAVVTRPGEVPGETAVGEDSTGWTVLGIWRGSVPVPIGVIRGSHSVDGGDWSAFPDGLWATGVGGDTIEEAEAFAIEEMRYWDQ
jgi:hypothetical protein